MLPCSPLYESPLRLAPSSVEECIFPRLQTSDSRNHPTVRPSHATSSPILIIHAETNEDYDRHKKDSLDKQKSGKGHWKPELASDSEEAIKADHSSHSSVAEMQEKTKRHAEDKAKSGTSMNDGM